MLTEREFDVAAFGILAVIAVAVLSAAFIVACRLAKGWKELQRRRAAGDYAVPLDDVDLAPHDVLDKREVDARILAMEATWDRDPRRGPSW